ncbi:uncharacterized protein MELLADRAFT_76773 [Melampsora larici-populina 98AG31]|uniref:Carrier domain-containing protein n=1 Tax=Melampsora larici-populina (strain 98AG31 / pathotype 3-4-7) TaxID=747676 RepID=F4R9H8_MELLP|nr:uncharacterized protein MELLADRAFT_76773 [Melampsora larici-populina 98AG31]EGG10985.1 hypothetical protein MELLADRAFT_76773 [Melampsora larici-populina 98AG31]
MESSPSYFEKIRAEFPEFKRPDLNLKTYNPSSLAEFHPLNNPNCPFGVLAGSEGHSLPQDVVTWNEVGSAMVSAASSLLKVIDYFPTSRPPVIGLIASKDPLVYYTMLLSIIRLGAIPLLISPRNSVVGIAHLIRASGCKHVYVEFCPDRTPSESPNMSVSEKLSREQMDEVLKELSDFNPITLLEIPSAFALFPRLADGISYKFNHNLSDELKAVPKFEHTEFDPVLFFHSSGTTGLPKLVPINRITFRGSLISPDYGEFAWTGELVSAMALPPYHALGVHVSFVLSLSRGVVGAFFRPELDQYGRCTVRTPNPVTIMQGMRLLGCTIVVLSPLTISEYAHEASSLMFLQGVKRLCFGGAPLSIEVGNLLYQKGVKMSSIFGLEAGVVSVCLPDPCYGPNWEYFGLSSQMKAQLVEQEDGLYELVIIASDHHRCSLGFEQEFGPQVYHTSDLLEKHPRLPLYRHMGRLDDQITLVNSEKTNPIPLETIIAADPAVEGALLFGRGKPQVGVIIEPQQDHVIDTQDPLAVERYIDLIWPSIEAANKVASAHSRLTRNLLLITDPRIKPLPKTSKSAVARKPTLQLLAAEIDAIYERNPIEDHSASYVPLTDPSGQISEASIHSIIAKILKSVMGRDIKEEEDIFLQGCDSVHVASIRSKLISLIKKGTQKSITVPTNLVYHHPTISQLSKWLTTVLSESNLQNATDHLAPIKLMIDRYSPKPVLFTLNNSITV